MKIYNLKGGPIFGGLTDNPWLKGKIIIVAKKKHHIGPSKNKQ